MFDIAKIAALYLDENNNLMAEVSFYYDSGEKIPCFTGSNKRKSVWKGFSDDSEVVAFNEVGI